MEFALVAQLLTVILVGVVDFGLVLFKRFQLDTSLSAGANFAVVNASAVSSAGGAVLARQLADIVASGLATDYANAMVVVNNGPAQTRQGGVSTASGVAVSADLCYCPTGARPVVWGLPTLCGASCASGARAGKFVRLVASRAHRPLFANYGIVQSGAITVEMLVQTG